MSPAPSPPAAAVIITAHLIAVAEHFRLTGEMPTWLAPERAR